MCHKQSIWRDFCCDVTSFLKEFWRFWDIFTLEKGKNSCSIGENDDDDAPSSLLFTLLHQLDTHDTHVKQVREVKGRQTGVMCWTKTQKHTQRKNLDDHGDTFSV